MATPFQSRGFLPFENPISQWVEPRRNALMGLSAGFLSGDPSRAMTGAMQGAQLDQQYSQLQADQAQEAEQTNMTKEWLRQRGRDDLIPLVDAGQGMFALQQATQTPESNLTADMQNYQFAQENPGFAAFIGGGNTAKPPAIETRFNTETGQEERVQWNPQTGTWDAFGGVKAQTGRDAPMNSTIQKELFEADEAVQAGQAVLQGLDRALELNPQAYDGPFADQRSYGASLFGEQGGIATQELKNVVTAQALESLKAVFGGMPTEGERKILLEIQGSVDQPKPVREAIYKRARAAAERRIAENARKAAALRSGQYFEGGYSAQTQPAGNVTSTGVQWSIEP
jgi:hypothetical protein